MDGGGGVGGMRREKLFTSVSGKVSLERKMVSPLGSCESPLIPGTITFMGILSAQLCD